MSNLHPTACILCSRNCGLTVETEDRTILRIKGDPAHPFTQGYICQKAARLDFYQNSPDRLTTPLKRQADGTFQPVSWELALTEIAGRLNEIKTHHGGDAFAFAGGGGQGNHLGGAYSRQLLAAMGSYFSYNSLGQEKTGDFWLNGRLFGKQNCHTTEDVEHADYVLFIGCNPYQAHGIPNARDTLKHIRKDPNRTMVVIDPRRTETAEMADVFIQLKPGTDAWLMSAMLGVIVQEGLMDQDFLQAHTHGYREVLETFRQVPVDDYARVADVPSDIVRQVARGFAQAKRGCVRIDLGIQQTLNTTLNGYLEKMLYLVCGHFGKQGTNNLHTMLLPILGNTDERRQLKGKKLKRTAHHGMMPIAGIYPPNILPDEILKAGDKRVRAVFVDSANPVLTWANSQAFNTAFSVLDLLVVVDVAFTETAALAHYVLPASSQLEKWECTGFNLEFPVNGFHLRKPVFKPLGDTLPEPEIYTRLLEKMGVVGAYPWLKRIASHQPKAARYLPYFAAFVGLLARKPKLFPYAASILYRTLGPSLKTDEGHNPDVAGFLLPLCMDYARQHEKAVRRAGLKGNKLTLGIALFERLINSPHGAVMSQHDYSEVWKLVANRDQKIKLAIPEMLEALQELSAAPATSAQYPFVLMAGERRTYNANQIYRNPEWRKVDKEGFLRLHPQDAEKLGVMKGNRLTVKSATGELEAVVETDDTVRPGVCTLPHGYGQRFLGGPAQGPALNTLSASDWCEPFSKTPYHKLIPVRLETTKEVAV